MKQIETNDNFTIVYEYDPEPFRVEFEIYEVIAHDKAENGEFTVPNYEGIDGCGCDDKMTTDIEKANKYIEGIVKWDGCSHFTFGDQEGYMHLCGKHSIKNLLEVIQKVYLKCGEIMLEKSDKNEFVLPE